MLIANRELLIRLLNSGLGRGGLIVSQLSIHLLLARKMELSDYGLFVYVLSVSALISSFSPLGWPVISLRLISESVEEKRWELAKGILLCGFGFVLFSSSLISILGTSLWFFEIVQGELGETLRWSAIHSIVLAFLALTTRCLQAFGRTAWSVYPRDLFAPVCFLGLALYFGRFDAETIIILFIVTHAVALAGSLIYLVAQLPFDLLKTKAEFRLMEWQRRATTTLVGNFGVYLFERTDQVMIGLFLPLEAVGIYNLAAKLCRVILIPLQIVNVVFPSMLSVAYNKGKLERTRRLFVSSIVISASGAIPLFVFYQIAPDWILGFFGPDFLDGRTILLILSLGSLVAACTGVTNLGMVMINRERAFATTALMGGILNIIGNLALLPVLGVVGAAISTATTFVLVNVVQVTIVWGALRTASDDVRLSE